MVCGGVFQIAFNGLQKTIGNLALGRLGASEVTLEMANVCQLKTGVGQEGYSRENTEALDKAIGSVARHRTQVFRGHGILKHRGARKLECPQVEGGIEE